MANEDKKRALDAAIAKLEKDFGKGTVMRLGDPSAQVAVETIPTGSLSLDLALGLGGVPKGRIVEIYGPESSGKTTVALHMIAEVQKRGGIAGFIDAEHALDPVYAKNIGVDIDELYISQPDSGDQALEITETMVRSGAMDIIVNGIGYIVGLSGADTEFVGALPTALMKSLSGSGANGLMIDTMKQYGADSFVGRMSCVARGASDTTFYILAVYFGSVGITKTRNAVTCGLIADFSGIIAAIIISYIFFF